VLSYHVCLSSPSFCRLLITTSCRCRHEFCYLCVAMWKTCKCPLWHERNIINPQAPAPGPAQAVVPAPAALPAISAPLPAVFNAPQAPVNALPAPVNVPLAPIAVAAPNAYQVPAGHRAVQELCDHEFERYYSSMGWDTQCHLCDSAERWVNCCLECGLHACRYCTKYRT
jgi:hypothetical protein